MLRRSLCCWVNFIPVFMPALSPSMDKGRIVEWGKKVGDQLAEGDVWCTVETDKAVVDFVNATEEGFLAAVYEPNGSTVSVGKLIAVLVEEKGDLGKIGEFQRPAEAAAAAAVEPTPTPAPAVAVAPTSAPTKSSTVPRFGNSLEDAIQASGPSVIRIAQQLLDKAVLEGITPTGKGGRFTKADLAHLPQTEYVLNSNVEATSSSSPKAAAPKAESSPKPPKAAAAAAGSVPVIKAIPVADFTVSDTALIKRLAAAFAAANPSNKPKKAVETTK